MASGGSRWVGDGFRMDPCVSHRIVEVDEKVAMVTSIKEAISSGDTQTLQRLLFSGGTCSVNDNLTLEGYTPCILAVHAQSLASLQLLHRGEANLKGADHADWTPFHHAAYRGFLDILKYLAENEAYCDHGNNFGDTPLLLAAAKQHHEVVTYLLEEHFADKNAVNENRQTALHKAVMGGSLATVRILVGNGATIDRRDETAGETPLMYACRRGEEKITEVFLEAGADTLKVNKQGESALFLAARSGHADVVKTLLNRDGASTDSLEAGGTSAFCAAASQGHANIVKLLISAGKAYEAKSAFQTAARMGHAEVIKAMLGHMPSLVVQDSHDVIVLKDLFQQSLLAAVEGGPHLAVIDALIKTNKCNVNHQYPTSGTALHESIRKGSIAAVELLLSHGADPNIRDRIGITGFAVSVVLDRDDIVKYFLQVREFKNCSFDIDLNAADNFGNTPLHLATARGHRYTLNILLEAGLNVDARNEFGQASLHLAAYLGNIDIVTCLVKGGANVDIMDRECNTALILTARRGHVQICLFLLNRSCDYTIAANQDGVMSNPLECAAKAGFTTLCQILVDAGANPYVMRPIIAAMRENDGSEEESGRRLRHFRRRLHNSDPKQEMTRMSFHPRTLQSWCRIVIRNRVAGDKVPQIEALPLPPRFCQSLLLRDHVCYW